MIGKENDGIELEWPQLLTLLDHLAKDLSADSPHKNCERSNVTWVKKNVPPGMTDRR